MLLNVLFWVIISIFVGAVGYKIELNKGKNFGSNVVAAFVGVFIGGFGVHFLFWTETNSVINPVAATVGIITGLVAVKLEDYIWLRT